MEGSKRTTTLMGHLCSSTTKKKKVQSYDRKFVVKQYIKLLYVVNPLWHKPVGKTCGPRRRRNVDSCDYSDQTYFCFKDAQNHNLQLNLSNSYFVINSIISLVRAKNGHSWDTY